MFPSEQSELLAQALGVPLFKSDLYMPAYKAGRIGRWRLMHGGFGLDRGYYSGQWGVVGMPVLLRDHQGEELTWMSLSPHEIESQELGCRYAYGHTVVMGLGMGWVAINIALNPAVRQVTVVELDPEVIELFNYSNALCGLPEAIRSKLHIVQADALAWRPDTPVDFLYADIWRCLEEPQTLADVRCMQANVQAKTIYFWGQELLIHALADGAGSWAQQVQRGVAETIVLPLLQPADFDYPQMIANVVRLRRAHKPAAEQTANTAQISLRPVTDNDLEFLLQLYASIHEEEMFVGSSEEQSKSLLYMQFNAQFSQQFATGSNSSFALVCVDQVPIGKLFVAYGQDDIHIIDIAVLPDYQRRGIGRHLIGRVLEEAAASGRFVTLRVQKTSTALRLYLRMGFEIAKDEGVVYLMRFGSAV